MEKLLTEFGNLFPGTDTNAEYHINAKEQQPIRPAPYRNGYSERETLRSQIEEMREAGVMESSNVLWSSAVVTVPKENNSRLCVDNRNVSDHGVNPLQGIDDFLRFENPEQGGLGVVRATG